MDKPTPTSFASLYPQKEPNHDSPRKRKIKKWALISMLFIASGWAFQALRNDLQREREAIDKAAAKERLFNAAIARPKKLGETAKLGRFNAALTSADFTADLESPELHKYFVGAWRLDNPKSKVEDYRIICKAVDSFDNAYIVGIFRDIDLSSQEKTKQALAKVADTTDALSGQIQGGESITFALVTDLEDGLGPYSMICEAIAADNAVTAWKTAKD